MKNKLFFSLALLVAANTLMVNSAHAYTWENAWRDAGRVASGTAKAVVGTAATLGSTLLPVIMYEQLINRGTSSVKLNADMGAQLRVISKQKIACGNTPGFSAQVNGLEILPFIYILGGAITLGGYIFATRVFESAIQDFKSIGK